MSLAQFFRILAARWSLIAGAFVVALIAAVTVAEVLPPKFPATARVLMDVIKPDPVSGQVISSSFVRGYTQTQTELITDYRVAGDVVDKLSWDKDAAIVADYQAHNDGTADFRRYEAQKVIDQSDAKLVEGSNILEITYKGGNPLVAKNVVTALRQAYIDQSLRLRTDAAGRSAAWYVDQATKAQATLATAEAKKSDFERANGIVMAPGGADSETMKLEQMQSSALSARGSVGLIMAHGAATSPAVETLKNELNTIDDAIVQASQKLGTSHPAYIALLERKKVAQQQLARETAIAAKSGGAPASTGSDTAHLESDLAAQKEKVLALKPKLDELAQLQREVDLRKDQYQKAAERTANLKLEADVSETDLVPLGDAAVSGKPASPNKPLIVVLGAVGGLLLGIVLAIATELLSRRVRGPEDLAHAAGAAVMAVIVDTVPVSPARRLRRLLGREPRLGRLQPAQ